MKQLRILDQEKVECQQEIENLVEQEKALDEKEKEYELESQKLEEELEECIRNEKDDERVTIPAKWVVRTLKTFCKLYQKLLKTFPGLTYRYFCRNLSLRFRLCTCKDENKFLSEGTLLSYFKKERVGEYYRNEAMKNSKLSFW